MVLEKLGKHVGKCEHQPSLPLLRKINLRWYLDLKVKGKSIKLPKENKGVYFLNLGVGRNL